MELRKIQVTGGSTYIVSLPKDWANSLGLKPGDYVQIVRQPDMSLLLVPGGRRVNKPAEALIDASSASSLGEMIREFISYYLAGYDVIKVKFGQRVDEYKAHLKALMRSKLIGLETVEESTDYMVVRCLLGFVEFPVKDAIARMHSMVISMCRDALKALKLRDSSLAKDVAQRDDEVDRLYFFVVRGLKMAVENRVLAKDMGLVNPRECLGYRLIVKSMERVADHAARIAKLSTSVDLANAVNLISKMLGVADLSIEIYESSVDSLFKMNSKQANATIDEVERFHELESRAVNEVLSSRLDARTLTAMRLILESVRRIAEYGADIAEIVINLATLPWQYK
ncbi:AbrB/MazE/SpoVT family DNA-binding domain-containing protein, partial [Candidatus Bathyarchaeota archaeon]|nr:AbrB/MazE/SpoVT family DNA-binding domain-containing protein [Candidatus Bathyarchaeota archaeon]